MTNKELIRTKYLKLFSKQNRTVQKKISVQYFKFGQAYSSKHIPKTKNIKNLNFLGVSYFWFEQRLYLSIVH
jgi:hypothetical protein